MAFEVAKRKKGSGASFARFVLSMFAAFYLVRVISMVLTFVGPVRPPSSPGWACSCCVPMSTFLTLTSGRNRRLTISTTSTARLIALPLALTLISAAPPWKSVMHART